MKIKNAILPALAALLMFPCVLHAEELENPAEGAVRRVYNTDINYAGNGPGAYQRYLETFANTAQRLYRGGGEAPYAVGVDTDGQFRTVSSDGWHPEMAMWTGFLKRNNGGVYSLVTSAPGRRVPSS